MSGGLFSFLVEADEIAATTGCSFDSALATLRERAAEPAEPEPSNVIAVDFASKRRRP
jgi:hypothetical protein